MTSLKSIALRTLMLSFLALALAEIATAAIYVQIPGLPGDTTDSAYDTRVSKMRIELPDRDIRSADADRGLLTLSLPDSKATAQLIRAAVEGREISEIDILVAESSGKGEPVVYLEYKLDRCFIKSWSTSGDANVQPMTEVTFAYEEIKMTYEVNGE